MLCATRVAFVGLGVSDSRSNAWQVKANRLLPTVGLKYNLLQSSCSWIGRSVLLRVGSKEGPAMDLQVWFAALAKQFGWGGPGVGDAVLSHAFKMTDTRAVSPRSVKHPGALLPFGLSPF